MHDLEALLNGGFDAVPPSQLEHVAAEAKDYCYAGGDVRYCIAAECLEIISSCWGDDGAVRKSVVDELDEFLRGELEMAISEPDPEAARSLALGARSTLISLIGAAGDLIYG